MLRGSVASEVPTPTKGTNPLHATASVERPLLMRESNKNETNSPEAPSFPASAGQRLRDLPEAEVQAGAVVWLVPEHHRVNHAGTSGPQLRGGRRSGIPRCGASPPRPPGLESTSWSDRPSI